MLSSTLFAPTRAYGCSPEQRIQYTITLNVGISNISHELYRSSCIVRIEKSEPGWVEHVVGIGIHTDLWEGNLEKSICKTKNKMGR